MPEQANPNTLRRNSAPAWVVRPRGRGLLGLAAVAGASHAALGWAGGDLVAALLAAGTLAVTAGWRGLLPGHRADLAGALGVVWLAVAVASPSEAPAASVAGMFSVLTAVSREERGGVRTGGRPEPVEGHRPSLGRVPAPGRQTHLNS